MGLVHYDVGYHLTDKPKSVRSIRLLTGEDPASVDDYLIRKYGAGNVVLRYAELEPEPLERKHTCGYCGRTRTEYVRVHNPRGLHPAIFDETLWRQL